jgi:hypothetical protein
MIYLSAGARKVRRGQLPVRIEHRIYIHGTGGPAVSSTPSGEPPSAGLLSWEKARRVSSFPLNFHFFSNAGLDFAATTTETGKLVTLASWFRFDRRLSRGKCRSFLALQLT